MRKRSFISMTGALLSLLPSLGLAQIVPTVSKGTLVSFGSNFGAGNPGISYDATGAGSAVLGSSYGGAAPAQSFKIDVDFDGTAPADITGLPVMLFCIQLEESGIGTYTFQTVADNLAGRYGPAVTGASVDNIERSTQLSQLYTAVFPSAYNPTSIAGFSGTLAEKATAFQVAVWNIMYGGSFDVATAGPGLSVSDATIRGIAQSMLTAAFTAPANVALYALSLTGRQDYVVPFYNDTPGQTTPEPATYALLVGVATLGVVSLRRRFKGTA